jgi:hypothetical protein
MKTSSTACWCVHPPPESSADVCLSSIFRNSSDDALDDGTHAGCARCRPGEERARVGRCQTTTKTTSGEFPG